MAPLDYHRPPLKWAGGKFALLGRILPKLPPGQRLIEPFLGSCVVALNAGPRRLYLSDYNERLINFYRVVRDLPSELLEESAPLFQACNNREAFEALRAEFNARLAPGSVRDAALFLYLNRHGFNGLYRVNSKGVFNVPFGRYARTLHPREALERLSARLADAELGSRDFELSLAEAGPGDVVYCDPAYVPLSATSYFASYTDRSFGLADQERLAFFAERAAERGATVVISNHDTPVTRRLYGAAQIESFAVRRSISSDTLNRGHAAELLAVYAPRGA